MYSFVVFLFFLVILIYQKFPKGLQRTGSWGSSVYQPSSANGPNEGQSTSAFNVKASILFHRAAHLAGQWNPGVIIHIPLDYTLIYDCLDMPVNTLEAFNSAFQVVTSLVDNLRIYLPILNTLDVKDPMSRTILLTHALVDAATIKLYGIYFSVDSVARQRCKTAAQNIVSCGGLDIRGFGYMNPVMGVSIYL